MSDDDETRELPTDNRTRPMPTSPRPTDTGEPMTTDTSTGTPTAADPAYRPFDEIPTPSPTFPDRPLDDPLPYGAGFAAPTQFGYGVAAGFEPEPAASTEVARRERVASPVLAIAGVLSMGVAVWAIVGSPAISTAVLLAAGLVVAVLVGLLIVVRR